MSKEIFGNLPSSIPKGDSRIIRVAFDEQEIGARKSALPKPPKNNMAIVHVKNGA